MPQIDISTFLPQLFWLIVSFVLLYFFLKRFCLPNLDKILHDRNHKISQILAKAEKNKAEAMALQEKYEGMIARALKEKDLIISEASKDISLKLEHRILEHELELKVLLSDSERKMQGFREASADSIKQIAVDASEEILYKLLGENVSKDLLRESLEKLSQGNNHV